MSRNIQRSIQGDIVDNLRINTSLFLLSIYYLHFINIVEIIFYIRSGSCLVFI